MSNKLDYTTRSVQANQDNY